MSLILEAPFLGGFLLHLSVSLTKAKMCAMLFNMGKKTTFGLHNSHFHRVWANMKKRCLNPDDPAYKNYGGRGITICDRWLDFPNFIEDMYELYEYHLEHFGSGPKNCQLDRIDNNSGYYKDNCRWVTAKINCNNRRHYRRMGNAKFHTIKGKTMCMLDWAKKFNMKYGTLMARINLLGWDIDRALTTPIRQSKK